MKILTYYLLLSLSIANCITAAAQEPNLAKDTLLNAYQKGDLILNAGFSFGYFGEYGLGGRQLGIIPTTASLEYGITNHFSIGGYVGYASWRNTSGYNYNIQFISLGGRVSFHYLPLLSQMFDNDFDEEHLDFYISLLSGLELQRARENIAENNNRIILGPVLGFKYLFNNKRSGIFFEGGRGNFGFATLGLSFRL
ncbi:MAG: hypothetical protein ACOCXH_00845 [Cyclobacteriaceae bacterium]